MYRASGEPTLVIDVCQSAARMRRNYGDAAPHTYQHQQQAPQQSNTPQSQARASRSMEEGGDGVRGARIQVGQIFEIWYYYLPT